MTQEEEKYYEELFDMFSTNGWQHFKEYLGKLERTYSDRGWDLPDSELGNNKGVVQNLRLLKGFQQQHEAAFEALKSPDESSE